MSIKHASYYLIFDITFNFSVMQIYARPSVMIAGRDIQLLAV